MAFENATFARCLSEQMGRAGVNADELAEKAELSVYSIRDYLSEKSVPRFDRAYAIAEVLGCTVNDLCGIARA